MSDKQQIPERRKFLAALVAQPSSLLKLMKQKADEPEDTPELIPETQPAPNLQFNLHTVFVLITVVCVSLAFLRTGLEMGIMVTGVLVVGSIEIYRSRIRSTLGESNYDALEMTLRCIGGILAGIILGAVCGVLFWLSNQPAGFWNSIRVGMALGSVVGAIYPRVTMTLVILIPMPG